MFWSLKTKSAGSRLALVLLFTVGLAGCQPVDSRQPTPNPEEVQRLRGDESTAPTEADAEAELDYEEDQP